MADNTTIGSSGDVIATDDLTTLNGGAVSGFKVQRVKAGWGVDGTLTDVATATPLPVNIAASAGNAAAVGGNITAVQAQATGTASTAGQVVVDVSQMGNVTFHLLVATAFSGTVTFEATLDSAGTSGTWAPWLVTPEDGIGGPVSSLTVTTTLIRAFTAPIPGPKLFKVRCSAFTSGSLAVLIQPGPFLFETSPALAPSAAVIGAVSLASATAATMTSVNTSGTANTNTILLAADTTRKGLIVNNVGTGTVLLGFGVATTTALYAVKVNPGQAYEVPPQFAPFALNGQSSVATQPVILGAVS